MPSSTHSLLSCIRVMAAACRNDPRDDAELLARFAEGHDEAAFTTLVGRHGPLVWRVCQRLLGDTPDTEDAFQAAFLALARKASGSTIKNIAGWLHRVARRIALDIQTGARQRRNLEHHLRTVTQSKATDTDRAELYAALDEELAGLPESFRVPLVLRYLEGKTLAKVARILGCSLTAVTKRLTRGEAIMRKRLERRGLAIGMVSVGVLLRSTAMVSAVPAGLIGSTARAAAAFRSGKLTGGAAETARAVLGSLPAPLGETILRKSLWIVLACSLGLGGAALVASRALGIRSDEQDAAGPAAVRSAGQPEPERRAAARVDCYGDPLPKRALARLGTVRLRHTGLQSVAFSPDGKTVASGGVDGMVRLWEAATGKEIRTLQRYKGGAWSVAFSPDGRTVASGGDQRDSTVCLWDTTTGKEIRILQGRKGLVWSVAFSPDGKTVAAGGDFPIEQEGPNEGTVHLWATDTGKEIRRLQGGGRSVTFSSDGKTLASGGGETVYLWEADTGRKIRTLKGHKGSSVSSVAFSPDGKTIASGDGTVCLWDVATGKEIHRLQGEGRSVTFSPDGKIVATGRCGPVCLWEAATGKKIRSLQGPGA